MNQIFRSRIVVGQYLGVLLMVFMIIFSSYTGSIVLAFVFALVLIAMLDRLYRTHYTLTLDGRLLIYHGYFSKEEQISIKDIISVERGNTMKIGRFAVMHFVLVRYGDHNKSVLLLPREEEVFIEELKKWLYSD